MILVTGGTGLVGAHLLYHLSLKNDRVKAIYRQKNTINTVQKVFSYYTTEYKGLFDKIEWVEADITKIIALENAFVGITQVYHCAALVSFNQSDYKRMRKINIEGTANIVNFCILNSIKKLCYVSSIATIEKAVSGELIDENCEWNNESNNYGYAITKYGAEMEVWRASQEGVDVVIVNPGVILGSGLWHNGSGAIFEKIYNELKFYSEGVTGFVSVKDVVKVMIKLMDSSITNERYILVSENLSFKVIFDKVADEFGVKKPHIKVTKFLSEIGWRLEKFRALVTNKTPLLTKQSAQSIHNKYYYSSEKIKNDLGFTFEPVFNSITAICKLYMQEKKS